MYKTKSASPLQRIYARKSREIQEYQACKARIKARAELSAGAYIVPTKYQHDFCLFNYDAFRFPDEQNAANEIISGYTNDETVHRDYIRIVNQIISQN